MNKSILADMQWKECSKNESPRNDVVEVIATGEIIAEYPDDRPFPSYLMLGFKNLRPLHVVFAVDEDSQTCHIITVYSPDSSLWSEDFKIRRS